MLIQIKSIFKLCVYAITLFALITQPTLAKPGVKVLDPGIKYYGKSYNELTGDWYNWITQFPLAESPFFEEGPIDCSKGQNGEIWFFAGSFGETLERTCTIPAGKALFFSVYNILFWTPEDGINAAEVRKLSNDSVNTASTVEFIIDGVPLQDSFAYRVQSPPGGFEVKYGPLLEDIGYPPPVLPVVRNGVTDGYWYLVKPLPEGKHDIVLHSHSDSSGFDMRVTFHLTVGRQQ